MSPSPALVSVVGVGEGSLFRAPRLPGAVGVLVCALVLVSGCGGGDAARESATAPRKAARVPPTAGEWGSYPSDASLDARAVVEAYVSALNRRDGERLCSLLVPWISGRFDLIGTDPDAGLRRPLRCPGVVRGIIDFPWENRDPFVRATVARLGEPAGRGQLVSVRASLRVRFEDAERIGRPTYEKPLEDVVWLARESGAWRVAKLSGVAAAAALVIPSGEGAPAAVTAAPDVAAERSAFAAEVSAAEGRRRRRERAYRAVESSASCPGAKRFDDGGEDVVDYLHPAPPTPTPQLPAADLRAVEVRAHGGRICVVFELRGEARPATTLEFAIQSPDFDHSRSGFTQGFEVELRSAGRARVTSGRDAEQRPVSVPAGVAREGSRLRLVLDRGSFAVGRPFPGSVSRPRPLDSFRFRADVTVELSERRYLHDDLGPGPPAAPVRFAYP